MTEEDDDRRRSSKNTSRNETTSAKKTKGSAKKASGSAKKGPVPKLKTKLGGRSSGKRSKNVSSDEEEEDEEMSIFGIDFLGDYHYSIDDRNWYEVDLYREPVIPEIEEDQEMDQDTGFESIEIKVFEEEEKEEEKQDLGERRSGSVAVNEEEKEKRLGDKSRFLPEVIDPNRVTIV
jgi:hypothetical protein